LKYLIYATFVLFVCMAGAQQPTPPQFTNLLTDQNDYTCGGLQPCATWPMPQLLGPGGSYADPTWGTTTYRLAVTPANKSSQVIPTYSRVQSWNADNTLMFMTDLTGDALDLYDATTTPPTPINRITTDLGTNVYPDSIDSDALWGNTTADKNLIFFQGGSGTPYGLSLMYVDVSACTRSNCRLHANIVHTFSCAADPNTGDIPDGTVGNKIETGSGGQGGMFDSTDRYFSFTCDKVDGTGRHEIDFIRYDRQADAVTTQEKWYNLCPGQTPAGCAVWSKSGLRHSLIRMNQHPDSRFITVIWQCGARDATWTRGCGTELFDPSYNFLGVISPYNGHQDVGFDVNGVPVWVGVASFRNDMSDERSISIADLTKVSQTTQTYKRILLPCSYSRQSTCKGTYLGAKAGASHISMTAWDLPGYGLFSTMIMAGPQIGIAPNYPAGTTLGTAVNPGTVTISPTSMTQIGAGVVSMVDTGTNAETVTWTAATSTAGTATFTKTHAANAAVKCLSCGDTGWASMENVAVKIDSTAADGSTAQFWRIGRTMGIRDNIYDAEPHSTVNRDFTQIIWGSTWNTDPTSYTSVNGYWTRLSPPINVSDISVTTGAIHIGMTQQFSALCTYTDATLHSCTSVIWTSSNPAVATVDSSGLVKAVSSGSAVITASLDALTSQGVVFNVQ
jgi:Bacterial Ig-like domain (group 2)